jgi:flagella basal body P-ring formation protein FlgA
MRSLGAGLLVLSLLGVAAAGEKVSGLTVKLRAASSATGKFVRLDEVADISGKDAKAAGKVLLGAAPKIGARVVIGSSEVAHRLEEEGFDRRKFKVTGTDEVVVRRDLKPVSRPVPAPESKPAKAPRKPRGNVGSRKVTAHRGKLAESFIGWVRQSLAKRLACKPDRLVVRISGRVSGTLPTGGIEGLTHEVLWPVGRMRLGRLNVTVVFKRGRERVGRLQAHVETAARMNVLVSTKNFKREDMVMPGDLRKAELLLTNLGSSYLTDSKGLIGAVAARTIRAGQPLQARMFKKQKLVRRGQSVTLVAESGAVRVTERAIAKTDGGLGDMIVVKRFGGRPSLTARVAGNGIVKVD